MTGTEVVTITVLLLDYTIKILAVGFVPENRRPGSASAWLLLILLVPVVGLPLFLLLGSPYVKGRRHRTQAAANQVITDMAASYPTVPAGIDVPADLRSLFGLNRSLTSLPCVAGQVERVHGDYEKSIAAMTAAVASAREFVNVEIFIMAWDDTTDGFFSALRDAVGRGVVVRLLYDQLGSASYPGFKRMTQRLADAGVDAHPMMPIDILKRRWRRPDLRNHRKLLVVDGETAFMGSQNMIDSSYLKPANLKAGRHWKDLNVELTGPVVACVDAVFAVDWFTETGQRLEPGLARGPGAWTQEGDGSVVQIVPSGPGFPTEPNLRLFVSLIHQAQHRISITSPYFVPDESLLAAITTAAYRGVAVELFVSEKSDQFMVEHAQNSYYGALLAAGVRIYQYPAPTILHAKHFTIDDRVGVIGSSNMDMRSFALDYEITLVATGGPLVGELQRISDGYRAVSLELHEAEWAARPWRKRYADNVMRLTSALQ